MWEYILCGSAILCMAQNFKAPQEQDDEERERRRRRQEGIVSSPPSPYSKRIAHEIKKFAEQLRPTEQYIATVHQVSKMIDEYLCKAGAPHGLDIDRSEIAGSIGKGTCIQYKYTTGEIVNPDLDKVLFLNNVKPPFKKELELLAKLLEDRDEVSGVTIRKFSIEFKFWTPSEKDIKVDLLVAENLVKGNYQWRKEDVGEVESLMVSMKLDQKQEQALCQTQSVDQAENKLHSSAFAEKTVQVIRYLTNDTYVLNCVRLAKFWNSMIDLSKFGYVPARSCIIEMIAINAQKTTSCNQEGTERCPITGFRRFLEAMVKFRLLDISLDKETANGSENFAKPVVRDPVNKWNNLAYGIPPGAINVWLKEANKTLVRLEKLRNNSNTVSQHENAIDYIFGLDTNK